MPGMRAHALLESGALCNKGAEPTLGAQLQTTPNRSLILGKEIVYSPDLGYHFSSLLSVGSDKETSDYDRPLSDYI